jgi:hypothetical protein
MGKVRWEQSYKDDQLVVKEIHKVIVHRFRLGDVEDPDLYAAEPLYKWQESDPGKFVMEHAIDKPIWHRQLDQSTYGYQYVIEAELEMKKLSEYYLRFGNKNDITRSR